MSKLQPQDVVIAAFGRSAVGRAKKGSLKFTHPVDFGGQVLRQVLDKLPQLDPRDIADVVIGCSKCEEVQGYNIGRLICLRAGLPYEVPAQTVNRFCSSGLQTIYTAINMIRAGDAEVMVAGGVETMSMLPMGTKEEVRCAWIKENEPGAYMPMGLTAENVAELCHVTREEQDALALESHRRAAAAQDAGVFEEQILPVQALDEEGNRFTFDKDEGIRRGLAMEDLAKLKTVFKENGTVTAATSSQMSDAAAMVVLMTARKAEALGIKPLAKFVSFGVRGMDPAYMGLGPKQAVPIALKKAGLTIDQMDVIELNEAFAAQAIPCMRDLGMDPAKVNVNGGAMAMGHPLGATGAILTIKAVSELRRRGGRYCMVTMCIGGGMGAAGIFEAV